MENATYIDKAGNRLDVEAGQVTLHLKDRSVIIGRVYTAETGQCVMVTLRKSDKHLFRKWDAYGFNYDVLTKLNIDLIKLVEDKDNVYLIPVTAINQIGRVDKLNFERSGFELQRFISRTDLQQFQIS